MAQVAEKKLQVSEKLIPRSIPEGEVRKFKLIGAGAIDPATDLPAFNAGAVFTGTTVIFDPVEKRPVTIKNIVGQTVVDDGKGGQREQDIVEDIEFDSSGICYVNWNEPNKYLFLSRHDGCATNPFRNRAKRPIWEEIIPVNIKEAQRFQIDLEFDSLKIVKSLEAKELIAIAQTLSSNKLIDVNLNGNISDVRFEVEKYCKVNPKEVIRASKEKLPKIKIDIQDAVAIRELEFVSDSNEWAWVNKHGKERRIMEITPGHDPVETFATYLLEEETKNAELPADSRKKTTVWKEIKETLKALSV